MGMIHRFLNLAKQRGLRTCATALLSPFMQTRRNSVSASENRSFGARLLRRVFSFALSVAVVLSSVSFGVTTLADDVKDLVSYPLAGYSATAAPTQGPWYFEAKDFVQRPGFQTSDPSFAAPSVTFGTSQPDAIFTWSAITGAASYTVTVYDSSCNKVGDATATSTTATVTGLTSGTAYSAQVVALGSSGNTVSASMISTFTAQVESLVVGKNGVDMSDVWCVDGSSTTAPSPDGNAYYISGSGQGWTDSFFENFQTPSHVEAIVFWFGQDMPDGSYVQPAFKVRWKTPSTSYDDCTASGTSTPIYYIATNGGGASSTHTVTDTWLGFGSSGDLDGFKQGYVVVPVSLYQNGDLTENTSLSVRIQTEWIHKFNADGVKQTDGGNYDHNIYLDNIGVVTDLDAFLASANSGSGSYAFTESTVSSCNDFSSSAKTLVSDTMGTGYQLPASAGQEVRFNLKDTGTNQFGMSLRYTATSAQTIDVTSGLKLVDNTTAGKVSYRMEKVDAQGNETQVWPAGDTPLTLTATADNLNPSSTLCPVQVSLNAGESVRLEVWAKASASTGGVIPISIGMPFVAKVQTIDTSKGTLTVYPASPYCDFYHTEHSISWDKYVQMNSRWNLEIVNTKVSPNAIIPVCMYTPEWGNMIHNQMPDGGPDVGYNYYNTDNPQRFVSRVGSGYGISMRFVSPQTGYAVLQSAVNVASPSFLRVLKNGVKIYPTQGDWSSSNAGVTVSCQVSVGDELELQVYSNKSDGVDTPSIGNPTVTIQTAGNTSNQASDTKYSPLWERPYQGSAYTGTFTPPASDSWAFGILNPSDNSVAAVNTYDSTKNNFLYNSGAATAGYHFTPDSLLFDMNSSSGMSMAFTCPDKGMYDLSTALKTTSGSGNVSYRITKNGQKVFPATGDWYTFDAAAGGSMDALELSCATGDILHFEAKTDSAGGVTLSLGAPLLLRLTNRVAPPKGTSAAFTPVDYTAFESGYTGSYVSMPGRWNFEASTFAGGAAALKPDRYDSAAKILSNQASGVGYVLDTGNLQANIKGGSSPVGASLRFVSPVTGTADITTGLSGSAQFRITKNGDVIYPASGGWTAGVADAVTLNDISLSAGDAIRIEAKADANTTVSFGQPLINVTLPASDQVDPTASSYAAADANPYGDAEYTGEHTKHSALWGFDTLNAVSGATEGCDYYDSTQTRYLYNTGMMNAGYHFNSVYLEAALKEGSGNHYGISLAFTAPRADTFSVQTGLQVLSTGGTSATVHVRITKDGHKIWPADSDWATQDVTAGQNIKIPLQTVQAAKNSVIRIEAYAENIRRNDSAYDTLNISLASPVFYKEAAKSITNTNISAISYTATSANPFGETTYAGAYVPMEGRWNFEILDALNKSSLKVVPCNQYNSGWGNCLYLSEGNWPSYKIGTDSTTIALKYANTDEKQERHGVSLRFVSPIAGNALITCKPSLTGTLSDADAKVYYRVQLNGNTIYPADGTWETIDNTKTISAYEDMYKTLAVGDELTFQLYVDSPNTGEVGAEVKMSPAVTVIQSALTDKNQFSVRSDFITDLQIDPFWTYEYALDADHPEYHKIENYVTAWYYWISAVATAGLSGTGEFYLNNVDLGVDPHPVVSYTFKSPKDGFLVMDTDSTIAKQDGKVDARVRITKNGETIWPAAGGWATVTDGVTISFDKAQFQVLKGDVIRFEVGPLNSFPAGSNDMRVYWNPAFSLSQYQDVYSETNDIFNMLDSEMLQYFQALSGSSQFDLNFSANQAAAAKAASEAANAATEDETGTAADADDTDTQQITTPGDTTIVTEPQVIVTPGTPPTTKKKRVISYDTVVVGLPAAAVASICAGAVLLVGALVLLIVLQKKGILRLFKKADKEQGA